MHYVIHIAHTVLRVIADGPDAQEKAMRAIAATPAAKVKRVPGPLPLDVEAYAQEFKQEYLTGLANKLLEEVPTKVERRKTVEVLS